MAEINPRIIADSSHEDASAAAADSDEDLQQNLFSQNNCFHWFPCFDSYRSNSGGWERIPPGTTTTTNPSEKEKDQEKWYRNAFMKLREWSELVAGPEWKTFIRKFSKRSSSTKQGKFQYDPMSYALNFEDAQGGHNRDFDEDEDRLFRDFSSRYAAIPGSSVLRFPSASGGGGPT
ncbi:uncharacterized protein LOC124940435 [Impatiens glandulifera]|uniref:uncharacterized protein LOC124940435 n=1 Tax=Impatiens glandulifera TaxID=253017 RepID=UPI001FB184F6|nr:uncharacterized protein LOC124940435 [Impatiens glandulifera]